MGFRDDLVHYFKAGFPALAIRTHEEQRVEDDILHAATAADRSMLVWALGQGWVRVSRAGGQTVVAPHADAKTPIDALKVARTFGGDTVAVFRDLHHFLKSPEVIRLVRDLVPICKGDSRALVITAPAIDLPTDLEKDVFVLRHPLPSRDELSVAADTVLDGLVGDEARAIREDADKRKIAEALSGLTRSEAEDAIALALSKRKRFDDGAFDILRSVKAEALRRSGMLTWVEPDVTDAEIGGMGNVKRYVESIAPIFHDPDGAAAYGFRPEDWPRSIALIGIPGVGKSLLAKVIGRVLGIGIVRSNFGRVFGSKVGESEANIQRRNELVEAQAPVEDWWDEAEKALAGIGGSKENPWEARVGAEVLTWFEEHRARVLTVATINDINKLPPEMISRFQKVFFADLPDEDEATEIARIHLRMRGLDGALSDRETAALGLLANHGGFNGREIRNMIQFGMQRAFAEKLKRPTYAVFEAASQGITPISRSRKADLDHIREFASVNGIEPASAFKSTNRQPARKVRT